MQKSGDKKSTGTQGQKEGQSVRGPGARQSGLSPAENHRSLLGIGAGSFPNISSLYVSPETALQRLYVRSGRP